MAKEKVQSKAKKGTLKIDNVDYKIDDLSDNAKAQIQSIQFADAEIQRLNMQLALAQTARNAYMQALNTDLPKKAEKKLK